MVAHNLVSKLAAIVGRCDLLNDSTKEQRRAPRSKWGEFSVEQSGAFLVVICSICGRRVNLETSKTDEDGQAVHEECYVRKIAASVSLSRENQSKNP